MRKITKDSVVAFMNNENFSKDNTTVKVSNGNVMMYLHGSIIAFKTIMTNTISVTNKGFETSTTKERLNGVILMCGSSKTNTIVQKQGVWYWTNKNGQYTKFPYNKNVSIN